MSDPLADFAARLGPYFTAPDRPWQDTEDGDICRIRTLPGYIFDDDFWDAWHYSFPDGVVCHVAYYGPQRAEENLRAATDGVFELRWVTDGASRRAYYEQVRAQALTDAVDAAGRVAELEAAPLIGGEQ